MNSPMNTNNTEKKGEFADNLNAFRQIEFFSGMPLEIMKLFAFLCRRQTYQEGDYIFRQDDDDECAYYIVSGRAKLVLQTNGTSHVVREYATEAFLSIMSLMSPIVKQFSLVALEDTECIVMTREAFVKVVDQFPEIPMKMTRAIGHRVVRSEKLAIAEFEAGENADLKNLLGISLL